MDDKEWLDEAELEQMKQQLSRFTIPEPDPSARMRLIKKMKEELRSPSLEVAEPYAVRQSGRIQEFIEMVAPQLRLFPFRYWLASLLLFVIGVGLLIVWPYQFISLEQALRSFPFALGDNPFILFFPFISAAGVIYALRSVGTPMFELEMSMPFSFAQILFSRFLIVVTHNIVIALAASYPLAIAFEVELVRFVFSWLIPLLLYSSLSLLAMLRLGIWSGSIFTVATWLIPFIFREKLGVFNMLSQPGDEYWLQSKLVALTIVVIVVALVVHWLMRPNKLATKSGEQY